MSTFYGGEQLSQVVRLEGSLSDVDNGDNVLLYTIPTGFYGLLKFAFLGNNDSQYPGNSTACAIVIVGKDVNIAGSGETNLFETLASGLYVGDAGETYLAHKAAYKPTTGPAASNPTESVVGNYNKYLQEGDKFYIRTILSFSNQNPRYEIELHLFKKP